MVKRMVLGLVAVVAVIAVGGIGFATFSASAVINGQATAGTFGPLTWGGSPTVGPTVTDQSQCAAGTPSGSTWSGLAGTYFAPGDGCSFSDSLTNGGNLPGTLTETAKFSDSGGVSCGLVNWTYSDGVISPTFTALEGQGPVTVGPVSAGSIGASPASITVSGSFSLSVSAGNGCQGDVLSITITIAGTGS